MGTFSGDLDGWVEMSVRLWKGSFMVDTLGHLNFGPNVVFETLELYISSVTSSTGGHWRPREEPWRPWEAAVRPQRPASSCAQILALDREPNPLPTPPGPLKLRLFWK